MTQVTMYPGKVNSPQVTLTSGIDDTVDTIAVTGTIGNLPAAPNLFVIGTGEDAETVLYPTDAVAGVFSGVTRAYQGVAKAWDAGTVVSRLFCEADYSAVRANIIDLTKKRSTLIPAYSLIIPTTTPITLIQTELTTNAFPLPRGVFTHALKGTEQAYAMTFLPENWNEGNITAQIEFSPQGSTSADVSFLLYGKIISPGVSYDQAFGAAIYTFTTTCDGSPAHAQYLTAVSSEFIPTGVATGRTILWKVVRNGGGADTYTGDVDFITMKILYTVS